MQRSRTSRATEISESRSEHQAVPGKSTLTMSRREPEVTQPGKRTHAEALPQPLPNPIRGELESAIGISLGHVRVHDTEQGHTIAASHGARAVAIDSDIYMAEGEYDPDSREGRELLAHEVAHVAQSLAHPGPTRAAAKRDGDVNAAESEADAFASVFSARGGAMSWSPSVGVSGGTPMKSTGSVAATVALVLKPYLDAAKPDVAWAYLRKNEDSFLTAIQTRLATFPLPVHERLSWIPSGLAAQFRTALAAALGSDPLFIKLPELMHPSKPWFIIDQHRSLTEGTPGVSVDGQDPVGPPNWDPAAGEALATEVVVRLRESFARMVPRFVVQIDEKHPAPVAVGDLVTSHPLDRVAARLLCDEHVVKANAAKPGTKPQPHAAADPSSFKDGIRYLRDYRWIGDTNRKLWNWIEVKDPHDATVEDVAATLWLDQDRSSRAYLITASSPFFRVEPSYARMFAAAKEYAPTGADKPHEDNALELADSTLASDAAIAQTAGERRHDKCGRALPPDHAQLGKTLEQSHRQILRAKQQLSGGELWELVLPAMHWIERYQENLLGVSDERLSELTPVIEGQQQILFEAVGALGELAGMGSANGDPEGPVASTTRSYATAIGESHLVGSARVQLQLARDAKGRLAIDLLELSLRDSTIAHQELNRHFHGGGAPDEAAAQLAVNREVVTRLHAQQAAGQKVDPTLVDLAAASLKEQAVVARAKTLYQELSDLMNYARDSGFGFFETLATFVNSDASKLPRTIMAYMTELDETVIQGHKLALKSAFDQVGGRQDDAAKAWALRNAATTTQRNFDEFLGKEFDGKSLREFTKNALRVIENQQSNTAIIRTITQIAVMIGLSLVGGVAGNMIAGAVRGALIADAATASIGMIRAAQVTGTIVGLGVDAGINATGQTLIMGGDFGESFVSNFLGGAAVRVALSPITKAAQVWGKAEQEIANTTVWEKTLRGGKVVLREGVVLTASMITGAATDYVVHRIYHGEQPTEKQAVDWAIQGGSMAIGHFVGKWLHGFESRLVNWAEHGAQLKVRAMRMKSLAHEVANAGNQEAALDLLIERQQALQDEAKVIEDLAKAPNSKISKQMLETLRIGNAAESHNVQDAGFELVPLRLAGLAPDDASGKIWAGAADDIEIALDQSREVGIHIEVLEHGGGSQPWRVRYNNDLLTIIPTGAPPVHAIPPWTLEPSGKRIVAAAREARITRRVVMSLTIDEREAMLAIERGVAQNSPRDIELARAKLLRLAPAEQDALLAVIRRAHADNVAQQAPKDPAAIAEQRDLARIRTNTPGHIRDATELSDADVARSLNAQRQAIKAGDVDAMVAHFPANEQAHARLVLARASGFARIEAFNTLRAAVETHLGAKNKLYTPGRGSLADNIVYLIEKETFTAHPGKVKTTVDIEPGAVVILDHVVLARIKGDPAFAQSLIAAKAVLLEPRGFNDGINMFSGSSAAAIQARTTELLARANTLEAQSGGKLTFDDAVTAALDEATQRVLAAANPALAHQLTPVDPASHPDLSSAGIASQLNGDAGVTEAQITAILSQVAEADRGYLREVMAQQAEVYSTRRMVNDIAVQHASVMDVAAQRGIKKDKVYYYIFIADKSYQMLAFAHHEATGTPVDHYINGPGELASRHLGADTMLVVLDDVAGSGDSLDKASMSASANYRGQVVISPMVSTTKAQEKFTDPSRGIVNHRPNTSYVPGRVMQAIEDSPLFRALPKPQQERLKDLLGGLGFADNGLSMVFPYMAPDNNNVFWGKQLAPSFVVNHNTSKEAVKTYPDWKPK